AALAESLRPAADRHAAAGRWPRYYEKAEPLLEALTLGHFVRALRSLGCPLRAGDRIAPKGFRERLRIAPRHERLAVRMLESLPGEGTLRILELGAGTGGTTSFVVPNLPAGRARYVVTDLSPAFLSLAREEFASHRFVEYRTLDLESDPGPQGFEERSFDVV